MDPIYVRISSPRLLAKLEARTTPALDASGVITRDLARYYALLERERPGCLITPDEACLIRDVLPGFRAAGRNGDEATLPDAVAAHVAAGNGTPYEVDVGALVERLPGLSAVRLLAVIDRAERMNAAGPRGDFEGCDRVRREFGTAG
jgi:hypothetical protein